MDAPCKIQGSIHVFRLVNNMCPGKWVHIRCAEGLLCVLFCMKNSWIGQKKTAPKGCLTNYLVGFNGNGNWIVVVGISSGGV